MKKERGITIIGAADIGKTTLAEVAGKITPIVETGDISQSFTRHGMNETMAESQLYEYMLNTVPDTSKYLAYDGQLRNEAKHKATCKANRKKRKKKNKKRR